MIVFYMLQLRFSLQYVFAAITFVAVMLACDSWLGTKCFVALAGVGSLGGILLATQLAGAKGWVVFLGAIVGSSITHGLFFAIMTTWWARFGTTPPTAPIGVEIALFLAWGAIVGAIVGLGAAGVHYALILIDISGRK
jgi:hypothetical protein